MSNTAAEKRGKWSPVSSIIDIPCPRFVVRQKHTPVLSSSTSMSARRYERETTIVGLNGSVFALEFSPDQGVLACGCEDGSVTVFSTLTWKPLHIFSNVSPSTSLTWHPHIEGFLFCGFKSGDVHALQTNHTRVRSKEPTSPADVVLNPSTDHCWDPHIREPQSSALYIS